MHYGVEEMFFVLAGTPTVHTPEGEETLAPGDVVYFPEGRAGLHDLSNPADEPARVLGISTKRFPTSSPIRSGGSGGWRRTTPSDRCRTARIRE